MNKIIPLVPKVQISNNAVVMTLVVNMCGCSCVALEVCVEVLAVLLAGVVMLVLDVLNLHWCCDDVNIICYLLLK